MKKLTHHWTEKSTEDFLYRIGADFIRQIEDAMAAAGVNQTELATRLKVSEGRVSQVLNNPGNLTLKKIVEYVRVLGRKVAIVEYDDDDPNNVNGPINSEIFARCWKIAGMPSDFFALENATTSIVMYQIGAPQSFPLPLAITKKVAATTGKGALSVESVFASPTIHDTRGTGKVANG